ncbi:MAG: carboxypeptidase-like regulatory domain-containing protein [Bryobacteraceae bacterium]
MVVDAMRHSSALGGALIIVGMVWSAPTQAQEISPASGSLAGILRGDDGTNVAGGKVLLRGTGSTPPRGRIIQLTATSDSEGSFRFDRLPDGRYALCANVVSSAWLNPCEWGLRPPVVEISRPLRSASVTMVLRKGAVVPIRVDDSGQRLAQHEGKTAGAHLLLGVGSDNLVFRQASIASRDATGANYRILIPFDTALKLIISSSFFQLSDAVGLPLSRSGSTAIPLLVPAGQSPSTIRLIVTGTAR